MKNRFFHVYIVPAAVFQSVMIGGGYGTGREVVEYFTRFGAVGGLLGLAAATAGLAVVLGMTYDRARGAAAYDYRSFVRSIAGRAWVAYEALYLLLLLLVLAVVGAAASEMLSANFGVPKVAGAGLILALIAIITLFGRTLIERSLTVWAILLSAIFVAYFMLAVTGEHAGKQAVTTADAGLAWLPAALQYALYNVAIAPGLLFSIRAIETRREAYGAAVAAAIAGIAPAVMFHVTFLPYLPEIVSEPLPTYRTLARIGASWFLAIYTIGLVGTLVQTGVGIIHGVIERIESWRAETGRGGLGARSRAGVAIGAVGLSILLSSAGIIPLIANGYGLLAWGFLLVYVVPLTFATLLGSRRP
jgi:uncharacterized membrane protein YkvI